MAHLAVMTTEYDALVGAAGGFVEVVDRITADGITSVQLQLGSVVAAVSTSDALLRGLDVLGDHLSPELATAASDVLSSRGIEVAAVDGTYNMAHPDPARRARNLDHLLALIELAPSFGTSVVTLCTGTRADIMWSPHEQNRSCSAWADLLAQLRVAVPAAERAGVVLAFEPEHNNVVDSAPVARRLLDDIASPALRVLLDGANLFARGDLARMPEHLTEVFALLGPDIALAHAKDLDHDGDAGGRAAGQGRLDYAAYLAGLQACGFDGPIVLHQLAELAPDRYPTAFDHVREQAPPGYLVTDSPTAGRVR